MPPIDPRSPVPAYAQVADAIAKLIGSGKLRPDFPIPSETQIVQEYGVSRGTARKAVEQLRESGLVVTVQGRGSFVRPQS
jgi:GntR family transcriptional regulator